MQLSPNLSVPDIEESTLDRLARGLPSLRKIHLPDVDEGDLWHILHERPERPRQLAIIVATLLQPSVTPELETLSLKMKFSRGAGYPIPQSLVCPELMRPLDAAISAHPTLKTVRWELKALRPLEEGMGQLQQRAQAVQRELGQKLPRTRAAGAVKILTPMS